MWWFGPCAGCSCRLSDVAPTSNWVDLRRLDDSPPSSVLMPMKSHPGLYIARHRVTQELVALKVLDRRLLRQRAKRHRLHQEVKVLLLARGHQNLLQLYEVKAVGAHVELAFELARGGEVMAKLRSEEDVSRVILQTAQGILFLHAQGIVHGEVRPEHLLFSDNEPNARVLLAAFGRAAPWRSLTLRRRSQIKEFGWDNTHHLYFQPPFLLRRKNGCQQQGEGRRLVTNWREAQQIDVYALGVTLYVMLCSRFPVTSMEEQEIHVTDLERGSLLDKLISTQSGPLLSRASKDLLYRLLENKADATMSMNEVVAHPWLTEGIASAVVWNAEKLARHSLFTARYAEVVAAVASRPSAMTSLALSGLNKANAPPSGALSGMLARVDSSLVGGSTGPTSDTLEILEGARSSFVSTHGTPLLPNEKVQTERPSANGYMRLASLEMGQQNTNIDIESVVPNSEAGCLQAGDEHVLETADNPHGSRQKSLDKMWQVLLRQRRCYMSKSLSSGSSNDRLL